jgi:hypothetical protein
MAQPAPAHSDRLIAAMLTTRAAGQPRPLFQAVDAALEAEIGRIFCTFLLIHPDGARERLYTSTPETYPLGARTPLIGTAAADPKLGRGYPFLADGMAEIRKRYSTSDLLEKLGCSALANIPVTHDAALIGLVNLGTREGTYGPAQLERAGQYATLLGPTFALLLAARYPKSASG